MADPEEKEPPSEKRRVPTDLTLEYGTPDAPGYHTLASLMGRDGEYAIFRKFSSLNMLNLMTLQAELLELENDYKNTLYMDERNEKGIPLATSFKVLRKSHSRQKEVLGEIRKKLDEYNTALLKCSQVSALTKPRKADLKFIRKWLGGENDGEGKHFLGIAGKQEENPVEVMTWNEDFEEDFVALTSEEERDIWSSNIVAGILSIWHKTLGRGRAADHALGVIQYTGLESTTKFIITVLSAMIPATSIIALYYEKDLVRRIWIMMGLTFAFAAILTVFTGARRIEIFSATAAFAAVEVIFIGSTDVTTRLAMGGG